jgi:hypothetical protein
MDNMYVMFLELMFVLNESLGGRIIACTRNTLGEFA